MKSHLSIRCGNASIWPLVLALCCAGCDRTDQLVQTSRDDQATGRLVSANISPTGLLDEVKRRYKGLSSYEDRGVVRLRYQLNGRIVVDEAPMSVAWDNQGKLGLRVYSTAAGPIGDRWRLRLIDANPDANDKASETANVDLFSSIPTPDNSDSEASAMPTLVQQVLSRALPEQVDFAWLLSDPLISQSLSAGMAGFPPQLDMLLSPNPLAGLIDDAAGLRFAEPATVERQRCQVVVVERPGMSYRLWIDEANGLLRRIELPEGNIPPQILQDQRVSQVALSIELNEIRTDQPIDWKSFQVALQSNDYLVKQFVTPPVPLDRWELGEKFPAFMLTNETGDESFRGGERAASSITVLAWLADHPTCRVTLEQLARVEEQFSAPEWAGRVQFVSVWASPQPPPGLSFQMLRQQWNLPGTFALDREAVGRDLFEVYEAPTVVVLDQENRLQARFIRVHSDLDRTLPLLVEQLARGVNVAEQTLEGERSAALRYMADLSLAAASDGRPLQLPQSYPPISFPVREGSLVKLAAPPRAVGSFDQRVWLLTHDGELQARSLTDNSLDRWATNWKNIQTPASLHISPDELSVALLSDAATRLRVINLSTRQASELQLQPSATVVDLKWISLPSAASPRLAVIDSLSRTTLFDPENHEQLTGQCPSPPLVILDQHLAAAPAAADSAGSVVLMDGRLERLELSDQSTLHTASDKPPLSVERRVPFRPAAGPWLVSSSMASSKAVSTQTPSNGPASSSRPEVKRFVLGRGWLAMDEPAWFMLDQDLKPLWHVPAPLSPALSPVMQAVATDPATGLAVWSVAAAERTIHLLRADGLVDHLRVADPILGLSLIPSGTRLSLVVVHADRLQAYEIGIE